MLRALPWRQAMQTRSVFFKVPALTPHAAGPFGWRLDQGSFRALPSLYRHALLPKPEKILSVAMHHLLTTEV